jgi:hypothetical protein
MARFYFQPNSPDATFEDFEDLAQDDLHEARQVAARSARAFLDAEAAEGRVCQCCCVTVASSIEALAVENPSSGSIAVSAVERDITGDASP